jgi:hypothetical protein
MQRLIAIVMNREDKLSIDYDHDHKEDDAVSVEKPPALGPIASISRRLSVMVT